MNRFYITAAIWCRRNEKIKKNQTQAKWNLFGAKLSKKYVQEFTEQYNPIKEISKSTFIDTYYKSKTSKTFNWVKKTKMHPSNLIRELSKLLLKLNSIDICQLRLIFVYFTSSHILSFNIIIHHFLFYLSQFSSFHENGITELVIHSNHWKYK